jgi:hypothetical protein
LAIVGSVAAARAEHSGVRRIDPARRLIVFIAALAFALQSYITQTHIHEASRGLVKVTDTRAPAQSRTPIDRHLANCPICQAVVHAGAFVAPTNLLLHLPFLMVKAVMPAFTALAASIAAAHDWQSRAPPRF